MQIISIVFAILLSALNTARINTWIFNHNNVNKNANDGLKEEKKGIENNSRQQRTIKKDQQQTGQQDA